MIFCIKKNGFWVFGNHPTGHSEKLAGGVSSVMAVFVGIYSGLIRNPFALVLSCYFQTLTGHYYQNQIYFKSSRVWISDLIGRKHMAFVYLMVIRHCL